MDQGGISFADLVWKPRVLVEMKKAGVDLSKHYRQAFDYWERLVPDRPQLRRPLQLRRVLGLRPRTTRWMSRSIGSLSQTLPRAGRRWPSSCSREEKPDLPERSGRRSRANPRPQVARCLQRPDRSAGSSVTAPSASSSSASWPCSPRTSACSPATPSPEAIEDSMSGRERLRPRVRTLRGDEHRGAHAGWSLSRARPTSTAASSARLPQVRSRTRGTRAAAERRAEPDWSQVQPGDLRHAVRAEHGEGERHAYGAHFTSRGRHPKDRLSDDRSSLGSERIDAADDDRRARTGSRHDLLQYRGARPGLRLRELPLCRLPRDAPTRARAREKSPGPTSPGRCRGWRFSSPLSRTRHFFGIDINEFAVEIAKVTMMLGRKLAADELGDEQNVLPLDDLDENISRRGRPRSRLARVRCLHLQPALSRPAIGSSRSAAPTYAA